MDHTEVGRHWDSNAEAWTRMARAGYDVCRDLLNTPTFLDMLPDVRGLAGLDIGCGEGHNTRCVADRGARMTAVDIAPVFLGHAVAAETEAPRGIGFVRASAVALPFADHTFDFAMATMSLMDVPEQDLAIAEAYRVLRPGGFLQFSITHPCFQTPKMGWTRDDTGRREAILCGDYFDEDQGLVEEWTFASAPPEVAGQYPKFRVPRFMRTLSSWLNLLAGTGFGIEEAREPCPDAAVLAERPALYNCAIVALFLHLRCRVPQA